ncbi:hypothetical protein APTSU1_001094300 [Apodemus speciosus]|uniref:Uncharacterized protein n=1 Tax=Apodemus speciosus TaxID=105296 RepID=A0ABQ0F8V6_APOSI
MAEEENAQAEAQEKKDEAEVQVNQLVHPRSPQGQK